MAGQSVLPLFRSSMKLEGYVEHIVYRNEENGYSVLNLVSEGQEITVVGSFHYISEGELLELTGGVIQGMSGSPILQNGKLIGAVTHVFVNDPTRGYGIFAETMVSTGE